jgi:hypothetical protein
MHLLPSILQASRIAAMRVLVFLVACVDAPLGSPVAAQENRGSRTSFQILRDDSRIEVREDGRPVLAYQFGSRELSQPKSFRRAHYVHPLYGLDGEILTEDFPLDHRHHRGIFWSWHQVTVGGRPAGDAWLCRDFTWESDPPQAIVSDNTVQIRAAAIWRSPAIVGEDGKPIAIASDRVSVVIHPLSKKQRIIDFQVALQALVPEVRIGGSDDEKGYGGFSTRLRMPDDLQFESVSGLIEPTKLAVSAGRWMLFRSDEFSYAILAHKQNPGESDRWILRRKRSMQNSVFPGRRRVPLSQDTATVLRYRLVIFDGQPPPETDFSELLRTFDASGGD